MNNRALSASGTIATTPDIWGLYERQKAGDNPSYTQEKQSYQMVCEGGRPKPHTFVNCDSDESAGPLSCLGKTYVTRPGQGWLPECTRYFYFRQQSCTDNHYMLNCCSVTCGTCEVGKVGNVVALAVTGEGCAQFDGKGTKCKKQKGCRWTAEVEYDKDGKCVAVETDGSEEFLADFLDPSDDETNEELLAEFLDKKVATSNGNALKRLPLLFLAFLSFGFLSLRFCTTKETVTYKELSQTLAEI